MKTKITIKGDKEGRREIEVEIESEWTSRDIKLKIKTRKV